MRVLLEENLDCRLKRHFDHDVEVVAVSERGWNGKRNGELLRAATAEFDAFVTMDRGIEYQQDLTTLSLGIVLVLARSNRRRDVEPAMPAVNLALRTLQPGTVVRVSA